MPTRLVPFVIALATIISTALCQSAFAQAAPAHDTTQVLRVEDLVREALANNALLHATRLNTEALRTRRQQATALPDPFATLSYQPFPVFTARGFQRSQWGIAQDIPFPGKLGLKGDIADHAADVAGYEADAFAQDLVFEVTQAFYEQYRIQEQQRLIQVFQEQLSDFVASATARYEVGEGTQQDVLKAQLERNTLDRLRLDLEQRKRSAAETLAHLLNRPDATALLTEIVRLERPEGLLPEAQAQARALTLRPEARALQTAIQQAETRIALAKKQFLPDFTVGMTYFDIGASDLTPTMTGRDALAVQVMVKIPLWRGKLRSNLQEAQLRRRETQARYQHLQTEIRAQISDLASRLDIEQRTLTLYEETLLPQAETTLEASLSAYTTDQTDFLNLLDAERMLFNLRMGFQDSLARYLTMTAALERALGIAPPYTQGDAE